MNGYNRKSPQKRRYDMPKYAGKYCMDFNSRTVVPFYTLRLFKKTKNKIGVLLNT